MKVIIIDNYDSFTYNLYQAVNNLGAKTKVIRNDMFEFEDIENYDKIILSPGPGIPKDAGRLIELIKYFYTRKPILGVCLGHQAIGEVFGGQLINLKEVYHGIQSECINLKNDYIFSNLDNSIKVGRYHSWIVDKDSLPECLEITALSKEGDIMALKHKEFDIHGVQFHPESILTPSGETILYNFLIH